MKPGLVVRERRLIPVTTQSKNGKLSKLLGEIQRSTIRDEILVCALVSPDGKTGVFLDETGKEYLIKDKELDERISYITSNYVKKEIMHYGKAKKKVSDYEKLVRDFLERNDTPKRYKDWQVPEGYDEVEISPDVNEELNEEKYKKGESYISDDGTWSFKVISSKNGVIRLLDLGNNKKYDVEVSDVELMKPKKIK